MNLEDFNVHIILWRHRAARPLTSAQRNTFLLPACSESWALTIAYITLRMEAGKDDFLKCKPCPSPLLLPLVWTEDFGQDISVVSNIRWWPDWVASGQWDTLFLLYLPLSPHYSFLCSNFYLFISYLYPMYCLLLPDICISPNGINNLLSYDVKKNIF